MTPTGNTPTRSTLPRQLEIPPKANLDARLVPDEIADIWFETPPRVDKPVQCTECSYWTHYPSRSTEYWGECPHCARSHAIEEWSEESWRYSTGVPDWAPPYLGVPEDIDLLPGVQDALDAFAHDDFQSWDPPEEGGAQ